jgi:hypothetical protein
MMSYRKSKFALLMASLLTMAVLFQAGCASSEHTRLRDRVRTMSDAELLNHYYGINDRLKDIAGDMQQEERTDPDNPDQFIDNQTFFVGGAGHGLEQKRRIILDELHRRGISP